MWYHVLRLIWRKWGGAPTWDEAQVWALHKDQQWRFRCWRAAGPLWHHTEGLRGSGVCGLPIPPGSGRYEEPLCAKSLLGEGGGSGRLVRHTGWAATVRDGRRVASLVTPGLPSRPPALGSLLGFCLLHVREGVGKKKKGTASSLRFWAHEQLTHVSHPFEVPGLFVEAEDHSTALDKLIVSINYLNDCHMQIRGKKSWAPWQAPSSWDPSSTQRHGGAARHRRALQPFGTISCCGSDHPSALKMDTGDPTFKNFRSSGLMF